MFLKQDLLILHGLLFILDETYIGLKKFATLLPNNWLARDPTGACAEEAWQTVGGKGADF
ncbi:hypothetical protein [Peribacillus simplex]|uniref:hypothetical protein n=1 Tax=Peribacillus simplex TaxID=1478 RepID=UPI001E4EB95C|nr:hypothetical protein [Peribacillus simplex]MDR4929322.1 hypothetical protein [Peribacillus simplex]MDR4929323.1 hypothetical protein [Peribacillus simplex]WHX90922.1 hypothetical protein QNH50_23710 [Peribacillus simplex]